MRAPLPLGEHRRMRLASIAITAFASLALAGAAIAEPASPCGHFTQEALAKPAPRENAYPVRRFALIASQVKAVRHRALFLGDSLTERWDQQVWDENLGTRGVLNAGVGGDRTEHLIWRLDHGNLDGPPPQLVIVLIGTNDIGHGRRPELAAEGVRAVLVKLREKLPNTPILLLGELPRAEWPNDPLRRAVDAVSHLIQTCADDKMIHYADIGGALLDQQRRLTRAIAPDELHFSAAGYARLAPQLDRLIDQLLPQR